MNGVGLADRWQPVRDQQDRELTMQPGHGIQDVLLVHGVKGARGFVENQQRGRGEQCAGQREPLPLAARQPDAAVSDHRVEALRQLRDEVLGGRGVQAAPNLRVACRGTRPEHVAADRVVKQESVLRDVADAAAPCRQAPVVHRRAVYEHASLGRRQQAHRQVGEGRLSGARLHPTSAVVRPA